MRRSESGMKYLMMLYATHYTGTGSNCTIAHAKVELHGAYLSRWNNF
jgi:hypothetical protein